MKHLLHAVSVAALLLTSAPTLAQEAPGGVRVGVGVSLNTSLVGQFISVLGSAMPATQLYVPIRLTPAFRLEPTIGWASRTDDEADASASTFALGLGGLFLVPVAERVQSYVGARVSLAWSSAEEDDGGVNVTTEARNTSVAAVVGGEYLLSPSFSIGVEGQLQHVFLGEQETSAPDFEPLTEKGGSATTTEGLFFLRAYLF